MFKSKEHFILAAAFILLVAACIFAGSAFWYIHTAVQMVQPASSSARQAVMPTYISGKVLAISQNTMTVELRSQDGIPLSPRRELTVLVDANTELYTIGALKDSAAYAKEQAAFRTKQAASAIPLAGPTPFEKVPAQLPDTIGKIAAITLLPGEDKKATPLATSIQIFAGTEKPTQ
jgi:FlaG/FlaF family flagellin (archaellin)